MLLRMETDYWIQMWSENQRSDDSLTQRLDLRRIAIRRLKGRSVWCDSGSLYRPLCGSSLCSTNTSMLKKSECEHKLIEMRKTYCFWFCSWIHQMWYVSGEYADVRHSRPTRKSADYLLIVQTLKNKTVGQRLELRWQTSALSLWA